MLLQIDFKKLPGKLLIVRKGFWVKALQLGKIFPCLFTIFFQAILRQIPVRNLDIFRYSEGGRVEKIEVQSDDVRRNIFFETGVCKRIKIPPGRGG